MNHQHDDRKLTFVWTDNQALIDWRGVADERPDIVLANNARDLTRLFAAFREDLGWEPVRVLIDAAVDAVEFLEVLASIPRLFRGDVVLFANENRGFLSAVGREDRVLFAMTRKDIEFYLTVTMHIDIRHHETQQRAFSRRFAAG